MDKEDIIERLAEQVEKGVETGKNYWESPEVQNRVESFRTFVRERLREYPIGTLAVALASGFILARLLRRTRRPRKYSEE